MAPPASAARALHDIIDHVRSTTGAPSAPNTLAAWQKVVGHKITTPTFVRFHAEVVELVSEVAEGLQLLDASRREKYERYLPAWWAAVVVPNRPWASDDRAIIEPAALDMLASLADLMEARVGPSAAYGDQASESLKRAVEHLIKQVKTSTDLSPQVRDQIIVDLRHVLWLLERVPTFGMDHAVVAAEKVAGKVAQSAARTSSRGLRGVAAGLTFALAYVVTPGANVTTIMTNVKDLFGAAETAHPTRDADDVVVNTVVQVYNVVSPQPALPPGPPANQSDETVEAEVVEEDEIEPGDRRSTSNDR